MSDQTFEQLWKRVLIYAPDCPIPIAQDCVNTAYSRALSMTSWTGLRAEYGFSVEPAHTGSAAFNGGDPFVPAFSVGLVSPIGRQVFVNGMAPYYTIIAYDVGLQLVTLDRPWAGVNGTYDYTICDAYLLAPADMLHFLSVMDTQNNWTLRAGVTQDQIDRFDVQRTASSSPWVAASASFDPVTRRPRWEIWPRPPEGKVYTFRYIKKLPLLSAASDRPIFPIRGDALMEGAFAKLAKWPGTAKLRNAYFDPSVHALHEGAFMAEMIKIQREDQELAQTAIRYENELRFAPTDAEFMQRHGGDIFF